MRLGITRRRSPRRGAGRAKAAAGAEEGRARGLAPRRSYPRSTSLAVVERGEAALETGDRCPRRRDRLLFRLQARGELRARAFACPQVGGRRGERRREPATLGLPAGALGRAA